LPKPFEPRELLLRIKNILNRSKSENDFSVIRFGDIYFDIIKESLNNNGDNIVISSTEIQLLRHLLANKSKPVSRDDLAVLCGGINERSVDVQITRLRNKIEKNPKKPLYIKTVRGQGYALYSD
jgi:two-component system phosphate regulon response regulator OmpR